MSPLFVSFLRIPEIGPQPEFHFPTVTSEAVDMALVSAALLFFIGMVLALALWWFREYLKETIVSLRPLCEIPDVEDEKSEA